MKYKIGDIIHINLTDKEFASGQTIALRVRAVFTKDGTTYLYFDCEGIDVHLSDEDENMIQLTNKSFLNVTGNRICGDFIDASGKEYCDELEIELFLPL
jgi:hypothetical protein